MQRTVEELLLRVIRWRQRGRLRHRGPSRAL